VSTREVLRSLAACGSTRRERQLARDALSKPLPNDEIEQAAILLRVLGPESAESAYRRAFGRSLADDLAEWN